MNLFDHSLHDRNFQNEDPKHKINYSFICLRLIEHGQPRRNDWTKLI